MKPTPQDEIIINNITTKLKEISSKSTVGMSYTNLKQLTPTTGVMASISYYHSHFNRLADLALTRLQDTNKAFKQFKLY